MFCLWPTEAKNSLFLFGYQIMEDGGGGGGGGEGEVFFLFWWVSESKTQFEILKMLFLLRGWDLDSD